MKEREATCLEREMEQMTTEQLDALLQNELQKETPDESVVLPILEVLEERERDDPEEVSYQVRSAWERYQERIRPQQNTPAGRKRPGFVWAAAIAAVLCLVVIVFPFAADADSALDILYRVTDSIVEFFQPGSKPSDTDGEYIFETDNPGLQQLYDKAVELGATAPVVPMWLPEGAVLTEMKETLIPGGVKVYAKFDSEESTIVIQVKIFDHISSTQYEQEDGVEIYDVSEIKHLIMSNMEHLSAMWSNENVECLINITDGKDKLYEIIDSIYRRK